MVSQPVRKPVAPESHSEASARRPFVATAGLVCGLLLGSTLLVHCGDDPAPEDPDAELDDLPDDEPDPIDDKPVMVRGEGSVDPTLPVPPIEPPPHWRETTKRPDLPDSGAKPTLPTGPVDPATAAAQMDELYRIAVTPVPPFDPAGRAVDDRSRLADLKVWRQKSDGQREALEQLVNLGSRYVATVGADAVPARVRFHYGYALEALADKRPGDVARSMRLDAVDQLKRFLADPSPVEDAVPDAELRLALALLKVGDEYGAVVDEAVDHLSKATALLLTERRNDDAGTAAFYALSTLIEYGRDQEAHALAQRLGVGTESFGERDTTVRRLGRRAALHVGATMPELEGVTDAAGRPVRLEDRRGGPVVLHLFQACLPTGDTSTDRSIETVLVPLSREFGPKGLQLIGGSLDLALDGARVEQIRANWEEWGKQGSVQDGSLETVKSWCVDNGMDWTLVHDGKWFAGTLPQLLGEQGPVAILLDADGVIRWRGAPPFAGLREALTSVMPK